MWEAGVACTINTQFLVSQDENYHSMTSQKSKKNKTVKWSINWNLQSFWSTIIYYWGSDTRRRERGVGAFGSMNCTWPKS